MQLSYYAIFDNEKDGINISFPDIPEAISCAYSDDEARNMAKEVLAIVFHGKLLPDLPIPTCPERILIKPNQKLEKIDVLLVIKNNQLFDPDVIEF